MGKLVRVPQKDTMKIIKHSVNIVSTVNCIPLKSSETFLLFGHLLSEFYFYEQVFRMEFLFSKIRICSSWSDKPFSNG
jgi:hypothetical protein